MAKGTVELTLKDKVSKSVQKINKDFNKLGRSVSGLTNGFGSLGAAVGGLIGVAGFGALTKNAIESANAIDKTSKRLKIGTDELQKFQFAANAMGAESDDLTGALEELNIKLGEAGEGEKAIIERFDRIGVSVTDSAGKLRDTEDVFLDIATAVSGMQDAGERGFAIDEIFGGDGFKILPLLEQGATGINQLGQEIQTAGGIMDESFIQQSANVDKNLKALSGTLQASFTNALASLLPLLQDATKWVSELANDFATFTKENPKIVKLAAGFGAVASALAILFPVVTTIVGAVGTLIAITSGPFVIGIGLAVAAIAGITAGFLFFQKETGNALIAIGDFILSLIPTGQVIDKWVGWLLDKFGELGKFFEGAFATSVRVLNEILNDVASFFETTWNNVVKSLDDLGVFSGLNTVLTTLKDSLNFVSTGFDNVAGKIGGFVKGIKEAAEESSLLDWILDGNTLTESLEATGKWAKTTGGNLKKYAEDTEKASKESKKLETTLVGQDGQGGVAGGYQKLQQEIEKTKPKEFSAGDTLSQAVGGITGGSQFASFATGASTPEAALASALLQGLQSTEAYNEITTTLNQTIAEGLNPALEGLLPLVEALAPVLQELKGPMTVLGQVMAATMRPMTLQLQYLSGTIEKFEVAMKGNLLSMEKMGTHWESVMNSLGDHWQLTMQKLGTHWEEILKALGQHWFDVLKSVWDDIFGAEGHVEKIFGGFQTTLDMTLGKDSPVVKAMNKLRESLDVGPKGGTGKDIMDVGGVDANPITPWASGGLITGRLHSQGGQLINAEGGEYIMSRKAVNRFGVDAMNAINNGVSSMGGGTQVVVYADLEGRVKLPIEELKARINEQARRNQIPLAV